MNSYKKSEITKQKIIDAACELFYEKGYDATSIREICLKSGASLSRVNYHFQSKSELARAIYMAIVANFNEAISDILKDHKKDIVYYNMLKLAVTLKYYFSDTRGVAFCSELIQAGILDSLFSHGNFDLYSVINEQYHLGLDDMHLVSVSKVYTSVFKSIIQNKAIGAIPLQANSIFYTDTFLRICLQLIDFPKPQREEIIKSVIMNTKDIEVCQTNLLDIKFIRNK